MRAQTESLRMQLATTQEQLKKAEDELQQCTRERLLPDQKKKFEEEIAALRAEKLTLETQYPKLEGDTHALEARRADLLRTVEDLRRLKGAFQNPDLARRAGRLFAALQREHPPETVSYLREGRRYLVTNLVLGTLKASDDPEITAGRPTQLTLEFEPHSVLSNEILGEFLPDEVATKWHVRPEYHPQVIGSKYDFEQSGRKAEERILNLRGNTKETWAWTVSGLKDFKSDASDLVFYMGYETAKGEKAESDVWRQKIEWKEKYVPGVLEKSWAWLKSSLALALGLLAALATIWASWKTIVVRRLEIRLRTLEIQLKERPAAH